MLDLLPQWLRDGIGDDVAFWIGYFTNGKHLLWYASVQFTVTAALLGGFIALTLGLTAAAIRNSAPAPLRLLAAGYINIVRGVPDVLFFIFFPIAFEQFVEWIWSAQACTPDTLALNAVCRARVILTEKPGGAAALDWDKSMSVGNTQPVICKR